MAGKELQYAIRFRVIAKYTGQLAIVLAALKVLPLSVALLYLDFDFALRSVAGIIVLVAFGWPLSRVRADVQVQRNEALVIVASAFIMAVFSYVLPLTGAGLNWVDAVFEAVSGVTTTGLTVMNPDSQTPYIFIFLRGWMQWVGGLGVVALTLALVTGPGIDARRISSAQSDREMTDVAAGTRAHARRICLVYLTLTLIAVLLLVSTAVPFSAALVYAFTSVSTGGFSTTPADIAGLPNAARTIVLLIGLAGAVPFALYFRAVQKRHWRALTGDTEFRALILASVITFAALMLLLRLSSNLSWHSSAAHGAALAVSAQSTTGYATMPLADIPPAAKIILIISMFTGGCVGSTAGGVKLLRVVLIGKALMAKLRRTSVPAHAVAQPRFMHHRIEVTEIRDAALLLVLFLLSTVISWLLFTAAGYDPLDSLFEVVSAAGTVGLSTGLTGAELSAPLKLLLCADMLLGRLELMAFIVLFYKPTWFGKRRHGT